MEKAYLGKEFKELCSLGEEAPLLSQGPLLLATS